MLQELDFLIELNQIDLHTLCLKLFPILLLLEKELLEVTVFFYGFALSRPCSQECSQELKPNFSLDSLS